MWKNHMMICPASNSSLDNERLLKPRSSNLLPDVPPPVLLYLFLPPSIVQWNAYNGRHTMEGTQWNAHDGMHTMEYNGIYTMESA